ncbi:N-acetyltransferase [Aquimarina sp. AD10]|uniref:Acetyltransferase n=1 Tax=Aquimarina aggregata TaxID=1642818 RepID=A0A162DLV2_9FLAO|nr:MULTISPECIES: GNAT family N-acetyltransferase [Aquimarina]AXT59667.1 N-acetyltransferase [Aquimarina sp. AD10]KZS42348.1 acetyltransferase [Aquimarina aggregata]RKM97543.1 N-acetyltransferase [Aquimarina sp. AD10]
MQDFKVELLTKSNSDLFFHLIDTNRNRLEDFFAGTVARTLTLEDTKEYCAEIETKIKEKTYFPYMIIDQKTKMFIGLIDVKNIDWSIPKAELGAFIDSNFEGKGIVFNSVSGLIDEIVKEHGFKKLLCRISNRNSRSINVALKSGFELEGTIRYDYKTTKGEIVDLNYYGKIFK